MTGVPASRTNNDRTKRLLQVALGAAMVGLCLGFALGRARDLGPVFLGLSFALLGTIVYFTAMTLTEDELAAIESRLEAASPGPWDADSSEIYVAGSRQWVAESCRYQTVGCTTSLSADGDDDAAFIAHARSDVPRLIAAVRASRDEAGRLRKYAKHTHKCRMQPWFDEQWCTCGLDESSERSA